MAQTKPTKPTNLMPRHFADEGIKNNFSSAKIASGFSSNFDDILQGDNLNYMIDSIGKELQYLSTVVDFIVDMPINKTMKVNANNNLEYVNLVEDASDKANVSLDNLNSTGQAKFDAKLNVSGGTVGWLASNGTIQRQGAGNPLITVKGTTYAYTDIPSEGLGVGGFQVVDKNGEWVAIYGTEFYPDGRNLAKMQVKSKNGTSGRIQIWADSNNTFHFDFPKCTTKATTTSSASDSKVAVVVQNYKNGNSWYRVWSDGWIEQGVCNKSWGDIGDYTFIKPFTTANITITFNSRGQDVSNGNLGVDGVYPTYFHYNNDAGGLYGDLYACGY